MSKKIPKTYQQVQLTDGGGFAIELFRIFMKVQRGTQQSQKAANTMKEILLFFDWILFQAKDSDFSEAH